MIHKLWRRQDVLLRVHAATRAAPVRVVTYTNSTQDEVHAMRVGDDVYPLYYRMEGGVDHELVTKYIVRKFADYPDAKPAVDQIMVIRCGVLWRTINFIAEQVKKAEVKSIQKWTELAEVLARNTTIVKCQNTMGVYGRRSDTSKVYLPLWNIGESDMTPMSELRVYDMQPDKVEDVVNEDIECAYVTFVIMSLLAEKLEAHKAAVKNQKNTQQQDLAGVIGAALVNKMLKSEAPQDKDENAKPERDNSAQGLLKTAAYCVGDRASQRDSKAERSMAKAVAAFTTMYSDEMKQGVMTEEMGWSFMVFLKTARARQGVKVPDDYIDGSAYFALQGEAALK